MKVKKLWVVCGGGLLVVTAAVVAAAFYLFRPNDLGLTGFDLATGDRPEMDVLRANIKMAADAFLARRKPDLARFSGTNEFVVDYSKSSKVRSLGYRSSFYYYCWDIYLPYSIRTQSNTAATVLVQLSDAVGDHQHDIAKFHVNQVLLLDQQGHVTQTLDGK